MNRHFPSSNQAKTDQGNFWQGKKVFITGHTGFKGSWLTQWLLLMGADVIGFSLAPPTTPSLFETLSLESQITHYQGDIRNLERLNIALKDSQPEILIHMAAQSLVQPSYQNPVETYSTNVMGTVNILEAARHTPSLKVVLNITSDKCYENKEWLWGYRENDPMGGFDPYSNSKGCAELVTQAFQQSFYHTETSPCLASARAGNVIGGGDWAYQRLIPDMIKAFNNNKPVRLRNPQAIRPWQHVLEPLSGYLLLAETLWHQGKPFAEGWNFGPDDSQTQSVQRVTEAMANRWNMSDGNDAQWIDESEPTPHEAKLLKLDSSKAKQQLRWQPQLDIDTALEWTVDWYKAFYTNADVAELTKRQINHYIALQEEQNINLQRRTPHGAATIA